MVLLHQAASSNSSPTSSSCISTTSRAVSQNAGPRTAQVVKMTQGLLVLAPFPLFTTYPLHIAIINDSDRCSRSSLRQLYFSFLCRDFIYQRGEHGSSTRIFDTDLRHGSSTRIGGQVQMKYYKKWRQYSYGPGNHHISLADRRSVAPHFEVMRSACEKACLSRDVIRLPTILLSEIPPGVKQHRFETS
jgi:hypothetical protein